MPSAVSPTLRGATPGARLLLSKLVTAMVFFACLAANATTDGPGAEPDALKLKSQELMQPHPSIIASEQKFIDGAAGRRPDDLFGPAGITNFADAALETALTAAPTPLKVTDLAKEPTLRERVSAKTAELLVTSMGLLGIPYKRGGNTEDSGFDCSGFVRAVYERTAGLILPRQAKDQATAGDSVDKRDLQPGDLVFFNTLRRTFSHVGIYMGEGKFIHSPKPGSQVRVDDMGKTYWQQRFDGARRVLNAPAEAEPVRSSSRKTHPLPG